MFSERAENGIAFLGDCLLEGQPAETAIFRLADHLSLTPTQDGLSIVNLDTHVSCRLNATASLILSYCTQDHTLREIAELVSESLRPEGSRSDPNLLLMNTLWHLRSLNLIRIISPSAPTPSATRIDTAAPEVSSPPKADLPEQPLY